MRAAIYNSSIPKVVLNTVNRSLRFAQILPSTRIFLIVLKFLLLTFVVVAAAAAADWNSAEQELARKIVTVSGPGAIALTIENQSSLDKRDSDIVSNGLRSALETMGLRFVKPEQAAATVMISLSENPGAYVWVAQIRQGPGENAVVMISVPRQAGHALVHASVPLTLHKTLLWLQDNRILDVAVLDENGSPSHIAVLDAEKVTLYRMQGGRWQPEQTLNLTHAHPWPRDLRGHLLLAKDHLFDAFLPGVICRSSVNLPLTMNCHESDDPWPLVAPAISGATTLAGMTNFPSGASPAAPSSTGSSASVPQMSAFFASSRNFFTGALAPGVGKFTTVSKFYSAAFLPRDKYVLWLFASVDGSIHMVDGVTDLAGKLNWGSDIASVKTSCGSGWHVLATSAENDDADSVRAYEFPDRDPVAVSTALDFDGEITALWTETRGDHAIAVAKNRTTGNSEAFELAVSCNQ
jgi:hypothetical protein